MPIQIYKKKKSILIGIAVMFVILAVLITGCGRVDSLERTKIVEHKEGELVIHFVDVGQGDCIIIQFPDNKTMIIDGGPRSARNAVLNYIENLEIKTFDYLLLTHTDEDHCGSLSNVILNYEIKTIFMPDVSTDTITTVVYRTFVNAVIEEEKSGAAVYKSNFDCDFENSDYGYYMDFVTPNPENYSKVKSGNAESINSISPIMVLTFFDKKIMFTGDANLMTEEVFFKNIEDKDVNDYNVDILKVAHHGSRTSTSTEFLNIVKPEIAVICVGGKNTYGHPTAELLARLNVCNGGGPAAVYRTDRNGDVIIKLTSNGTDATILPVILENDLSSLGAIVILINQTDFKTLMSGILINKRYLI